MANTGQIAHEIKMSLRQRRVVLDEENLNIDPIYGEELQELDYQRLYVTNLPPQLTDDGVHNYFNQCGKVKSVYVNREHAKLFAMVDFTCVADAQRACMTLNNTPPFNLQLRYAFKKKQNFSSGQSSGYNTQKWDQNDENSMMMARKQITGASVWNGNTPVRGRAKQYYQQYEVDDDFYDDESVSMGGGDEEYDDKVDEELGELTSRIQRLLKRKKEISIARTVQVASKGKFPDAMKMKVVIQQNPIGSTEPIRTIEQHLEKPVQYERAMKSAENLTVQYRSPKFGLADLQNAIEECASAEEMQAVANSPPEMLRSLCLVCGSEASTVCGACRTAPYCSPRCQRSDWTARHAKLCHNLARNVQHMQSVASPSSSNCSQTRLQGSEEKKAQLNVSRKRCENDEESAPSRNFQRNSAENNYQRRDNRTSDTFQENRRQHNNDSFSDKSAEEGARRGYANKAVNRGLNPTHAPSRSPNHPANENTRRRGNEQKGLTNKNESREKSEGNTRNTAPQTSVPHIPMAVQRQGAREEKTLDKKPEQRHVEVKEQKIEQEPAASVMEEVPQHEKPAVLKSADVEQRMGRPAVTAGSLVVLTSVESPERMFVRRADPESAAAYEGTLHSVAVHALTAPQLSEAPAQGSVVLAEFGEEAGVFYRAAVMRTNVAANKYKLEYLEYGNVDKSSLEKMRKIGSEFEPKSLPVLVSRVVLAGYEGEKFNERAMDYLTQLKDEETILVLTIPDGSESAVNGSGVNLKIESTKKDLLSEIMSVSSPSWKKLDTPEKPDAILDLPVLMLDSVQYVQVPKTPCVLQVLDTLTLADGTFNCFHADSEIARTVLVSLEEELMTYATETTLGRDPYLPRELELCVAKYHEDGLWYRAVCLQSEAGVPGAVVLFLDYGNVVTVAVTDLRKMLPDFMEGKPAVASLATIEGFPPQPSDELIAAIRNVLEVDGAGARVQCLKAVSAGAECVVSLPEVTKIIESMK